LVSGKRILVLDSVHVFFRPGLLLDRSLLVESPRFVAGAFHGLGETR
jgi:hypothetical protein